MNDLGAPPVPELSDDWIGLRRDRLVRELAVPPRRQAPRRLALGGVGALAAVGAATAALLIVFAGARTQNAFAGWRAAPTQPASGQTAGALSQCASRLASSAKGQSNIPASGWKALVTDTRGPFTAMILQSAGATATCLTGPSFTTTQANATEGGASQHVASTGSASAGQPSISVLGLGGPSGGPISQATVQHATSDGQPYTFLQGQVETGVTSVTLLLSDGSEVQATVSDGLLLAWWPGSADAAAAQATSPTGTRTQQLTFTPVSPSSVPTPPGSTTPNSVP
jgi:hypothetical protein